MVLDICTGSPTRGIFAHQLYAMFDNQTAVDAFVQSMKDASRLRLFSCVPFGLLDDVYLMDTDMYCQSILQTPSLSEGCAQLFIQLISSPDLCSRTSLLEHEISTSSHTSSQQHATQQPMLSATQMDELLAAGFLRRRHGSRDCLWLSHPKVIHDCGHCHWCVQMFHPHLLLITIAT